MCLWGFIFPFLIMFPFFIPTQFKSSVNTKLNCAQGQLGKSAVCFEPQVPKCEPTKLLRSNPKQKLSPQKVVSDTSSRVKFAITNSLTTSVPSQQLKSKKNLPKSFLGPNKNDRSEVPVSKIAEDVLVPQNDNTYADNTPLFTSNEETQTFCSSSSVSESIMDISAGKQGHQTIVDSSMSCDRPLHTHLNTETADRHGISNLSIASTGTLMLKVDMRFGAEETHSNSIIEHLSGDYQYSTSMFHNCLSSETLNSFTADSEVVQHFFDGGTMKFSKQDVHFEPPEDNQYDLVSNYVPAHISEDHLSPKDKINSDIDMSCTCNSDSYREDCVMDRSFSTLEANEGVCFSHAGSLSGFEQPFSLVQSSFPSLNTRNSRMSNISDTSVARELDGQYGPKSLASSFCPIHKRFLREQWVPTSSYLQTTSKAKCSDVSTTAKSGVAVVNAAETSNLSKSAETWSDIQLTNSSITLASTSGNAIEYAPELINSDANSLYCEDKNSDVDDHVNLDEKGLPTISEDNKLDVN